MSEQNIASNLLVELSTEQQELLGGGQFGTGGGRGGGRGGGTGGGFGGRKPWWCYRYCY